MSRAGRGLGLGGLVSLILGVSAPAAIAVPFDVTRFDDPAPNGCNVGDCSLREALIAANLAGTVDSIALDAGTYALTINGNGEDAAATGDLDVTDHLTLTGAGAGATTIDGNRFTTNDRVLDLDPGVSITPVIAIADLRITDGGDQQSGGGIRSQALADVTLSDVTLSGNITNAGSGGAILNRGSSQMTVEDSTISTNRAPSGGAIRNEATATMTIRRTTIDGNIASSSSGGGIFTQNDADLTLESSTVSRNGASIDGGGLFVQNAGSTAVVNSTVSGNLSLDDGGGVFLQNDQTMTMANSTVTHNRALDAGGGLHSSLDPGASLTVGSTIFAGNEAAGPGPDCSVPTGDEPILSNGQNLIGDGTGCVLAAAAADQIGSGAAPIAPGLGPLAANGGPTLTHLPASSSPAIDAGDGDGLLQDQRGQTRTVDQPGVANAVGSDGTDAGAVELALLPAPRCKGTAATVFASAGSPAGVLTGTPKRDVIVGTNGANKINGRGGNDLVCAKGGRDTVRGGAGRDRLFGEGGPDKLFGGGGRDLLSGGGGNDTCVGGPGRDTQKGC